MEPNPKKHCVTFEFNVNECVKLYYQIIIAKYDCGYLIDNEFGVVGRYGYLNSEISKYVFIICINSPSFIMGIKVME